MLTRLLQLIIILAAFAPLSASAQTPNQDRLFAEFGLRLEAAANPPAPGRTVSIRISEVAPGSLAERSDFRAGEVVKRSNTFLKPIYKTPDLSLEQAASQILERIDRDHHADFVMLTPEAFANPRRNFGQARHLVMPLSRLEEHLGFRVETGGLVNAVFEASPAAAADLRVGDIIQSVSGMGVYDTFAGPLIAAHAFDEVLEGPVQIRIERSGKIEFVSLAQRPLGTAMAGVLPPQEAAIFAQLPKELAPLFSALYAGDFPGAHRYQMGLLQKHIGGSALGLPIFQGQAQTAAEASRLNALFAQYILVKSNRHGVCGAPSAEFAVTETVYETWTGAYGVALSRRPVATETNGFRAPQAFAGIIEAAKPVRAFRKWSGQIADFIAAAGACQSEILPTLEANMLAYQTYQP